MNLLAPDLAEAALAGQQAVSDWSRNDAGRPTVPNPCL
jgi:hypothetical protein